MVDDAAVQRMWQAAGIDAELCGAFAFGDTAELADKLAELVLHGPKRATAGLPAEFEHDGEPIPRTGDHWVVLDGNGQPVCVIRTTEVEIKPLDQVDAAFAWDEGEGDRSLGWWLTAHHRYFRRACERLGEPFAEDMPVVFERFDLVWP
jgi:uncharacterized protein YhfF